MVSSRTPHLSWRPAALLTAFILFAIASGIVGVGSANADNRSVTVMTQNVYQGTEFANIQKLVTGERPLSEAFAATTEDYLTYVATRFKDRAKQIAAEIAKNEPALVGLQEIATWHQGEFNPLNPFGLATPVSEDFTKELVAALAANGMHYAPVSTKENNFTLAFPVFLPEPIAVGMVESGVILARTDLPPGQLKLNNPQQGTYGLGVTLVNPLTNSPIPFTNSWQSIDAKVRGKTFRFITTHLDALDPSGVVRYVQAKELLAGPVNTPLPVIVTGDMNSGPKSSPLAYGTLIAGGLSDTWTAGGLGAPPLTCCHLAFNDLTNDPSATFAEDLDHVLTRGNFSVLDERLVGNTVPNPEPKPFIWPSDHAGVVATLGIEP